MMTNNRKGFTLIELLIVVVIIGILAAIAIPKFANTKEKAFVASMKADLKNLVNAQEAYFADNQTYSNNLATIGASQSPGNTIAIGAANGTGWNATATNTATAQQCGIFAGNAAAPAGMPAGAAEGAPACW